MTDEQKEIISKVREKDRSLCNLLDSYMTDYNGFRIGNYLLILSSVLTDKERDDYCKLLREYEFPQCTDIFSPEYEDPYCSYDHSRLTFKDTIKYCFLKDTTHLKAKDYIFLLECLNVRRKDTDIPIKISERALLHAFLLALKNGREDLYNEIYDYIMKTRPEKLAKRISLEIQLGRKYNENENEE